MQPQILNRFAGVSLGLMLLLCLGACSLLSDHHGEQRAVKVASPSGHLMGSFFAKDERLHYRVRFHGEDVVFASPLGVTVNGVDLGEGVRFEKGTSRRINASYPTRGVHALAKNHYLEQDIQVTHVASHRHYVLQVRAYDDGLAYRYLIPGEGKQLVTAEASSWTLPGESRVWYFERDSAWKLKTYAGEWLHTDIDLLPTVSQQGPIQGPPLVVELPADQGFAVLTEAALYNYSGMRLQATGQRKLQANFTEGAAGFDIQGAVITPWRVTLLANNLDALVNSDLIANLNPAPDPQLFADTSYIKPGRATWRWWSKNTGNPAEEKQFIDYAHRLGFEYSLIDDGWKMWAGPWQQLQQLTQYGAARDVKIFAWKDWNEIGDPANNWQQARQFLDSVKSAGAVGVKIDFMNAESKALIDFEIAVLRLAAERQLMVVFHGNHKPTGESRTYPNEISREGIRGLELNRMDDPLPASHNAALPFTRFLVGHGDYTPLGYSRPGATTYAHQLATVALFTSPLQVIAEDPQVLLHDASVAAGLDMLKSIPSTWDETRVLEPSRIGELAIFARRSGQQWFLVALNGTTEPVSLPEVDLSFLGEDRYSGIAISSPSEHSLAKRVLKSVSADTRHSVTLGPADGYIVRFTPENEGQK